MRFWDSSAIVPTLVAEESSEAMRSLLAADPIVTTWWTTRVECVSAIARRERRGEFDPAEAGETLETLRVVADTWIEIPPSMELRETALRIVRVHDVRAADALQLAAARAASEQGPDQLPFVTLDERLALAASREGFPVVPR